MFLHINRIIETTPLLHLENTFPDKIPLRMTNMIVKIKKGCTILTPDLLLQTATTIKIIPVILEIVRDQLILIEILQIVSLHLQTKETNHEP